MWFWNLKKVTFTIVVSHQIFNWTMIGHLQKQRLFIFKSHQLILGKNLLIQVTQNTSQMMYLMYPDSIQ